MTFETASEQTGNPIISSDSLDDHSRNEALYKVKKNARQLQFLSKFNCENDATLLLALR